ncbi:MAG: hypothetical protein CYG60_17515 [Actinobacteria bacterium]|jgi:hypothetical protein|nr:MAG: hypothetical protein CYG60_17515 [Actinomycetota bacterium]
MICWLKQEEDLWGNPVIDRKSSDYDEREGLRYALLRVGLRLDDDALDKLVPQARALQRNGAQMVTLDLSKIEPGFVFDARWKK